MKLVCNHTCCNDLCENSIRCVALTFIFIKHIKIFFIIEFLRNLPSALEIPVRVLALPLGQLVCVIITAQSLSKVVHPGDGCRSLPALVR